MKTPTDLRPHDYQPGDAAYTSKLGHVKVTRCVWGGMGEPWCEVEAACGRREWLPEAGLEPVEDPKIVPIATLRRRQQVARKVT